MDVAAAKAEKRQKALDSSRTLSLEVFFRKLLSLVCTLIYELCHSLDLGSTIQNHVWTTMKHALSNHYGLMKGRHIHHLILCTVYGICKVNKRVPEVKFTAIITKYKELRQSGSLVHHIPLKSENERGDIIKFYNAIFIPTMKVVLTQFSPKDSSAGPTVNEMPAPRTRTTPQRVGLSNVHVNNTTASAQRLSDLSGKSGVGGGGFRSPRPPLPRPPSTGSLSGMGGSSAGGYLIGGGGHPSMTPRTKALYAFGESPSKDLHMINQAIGRGSPGANMAGYKRDHPHGTDMSKAPVLNVDLDMEMPSGGDEPKAKMRKLIAQRASRGGGGAGGGSGTSGRRPSPDSWVSGKAMDDSSSGSGGEGAAVDVMEES